MPLTLRGESLALAFDGTTGGLTGFFHRDAAMSPIAGWAEVSR